MRHYRRDGKQSRLNMQTQAKTSNGGPTPTRTGEGVGGRFDLPETANAPSANRARPDFWSAAGAIFAQQNRVPRLTRCIQGGPAPLSLAQERLWTLEQSEQGAPYYHVPLTWQISGQLDIAALEKSLDFLIQRHE